MLFRALIARPLRHDLGRTLLSLAAIALGVAVVIAIRIANRAAVSSFAATTASLANGADLLVTGPAPIPATLLPQLFPLNAEAEILPFIHRRAYDPVHHDALDILGLDLVAAARRRPEQSGRPLPGSEATALSDHRERPESGVEYPLAEASQRGIPLSTPDNADASHPLLLVPHNYLARHALHPGDTLILALSGRLHTFSIAAAPAGDFALLDLPAALAAFEPNQPPAFDGLRIMVAPGANRERVQTQLSALVPAPDTVAAPAARVENQAAMLAAFRANLAALSYVALLVGLFLIYNTVSISVVRRRLAIATLRALGATRRSLLRLFLAEGAALALVGGALGVLLGWLIAARALALVQRTVASLYVPGASAAPTAAQLAPSDWLWGLVLALAAGLLAAWAPARQAAALRPATVLRPGAAEAAVRARAAWGWPAAIVLAAAAVVFARLPAVNHQPWFGFAAALAAVLTWAALTPWILARLLPPLRRALLHRRHTLSGLAAASLNGALRRTAVLVVAVATAIGVMLGVAIMVGSFRQTVNVWLSQQLQNDVFVQAADWDRNHPVPLPDAVLAAAAAVPEARAVAASHTQPWTFRQQPITLNTRWPLLGAAALPRYRFLAGGPGPVIVSEPFARRFHLWPGDRFTLDAPRGSLPLTVSGVFYDYSSDRGLLTLDRATFQQGFGPPRATELGFDAAPGVTPSLLHLDLEKHLPGALNFIDNATLRRQAIGVFDQTFRITYALEVITLLVAILGVGNTLLAVVLERAREFAILRFLGATAAQIRRLLLAEAGVVALLALAIGWLMAIALAYILVRVINVQSFGWTIQMHPPVAFLIAASAIVWLATVAAAALPARAARRHATPSALEAE
ncbi:MAG TPA: ABC transporter permease [Terriglobales bacterium]|nr:ABC transporter permease [Terriglobales bacterium]